MFKTKMGTVGSSGRLVGTVIVLQLQISGFKFQMCYFFVFLLKVIYLKPSYFSGTLILVILVRGLVITKFNTH